MKNQITKFQIAKFQIAKLTNYKAINGGNVLHCIDDDPTTNTVRPPKTNKTNSTAICTKS